MTQTILVRISNLVVVIYLGSGDWNLVLLFHDSSFFSSA